MNHKYNRQPPQRQPQQQIRSTFLPKLCSSSSTKDQVKLSHRSCSSLSNEDPTSPRVGCMGQVKRNNKVIGFPTIISFSSTPISKTDQISNSTISLVKYHKLKKLFSTKSLFNVASPTLVRATNVARTNERRLDHSRKLSRSKMDGNRNSDDNSGNIQKGCLVNLEELDPPLPVIKKINKQQVEEQEEEINKGESLSLWKRRSGGVPLKSLQVQVIHNQGHSVFSS